MPDKPETPVFSVYIYSRMCPFTSAIIEIGRAKRMRSRPLFEMSGLWHFSHAYLFIPQSSDPRLHTYAILWVLAVLFYQI
jgi:hypothetical protein